MQNNDENLKERFLNKIAETGCETPVKVVEPCRPAQFYDVRIKGALYPLIDGVYHENARINTERTVEASSPQEAVMNVLVDLVGPGFTIVQTNQTGVLTAVYAADEEQILLLDLPGFRDIGELATAVSEDRYMKLANATPLFALGEGE
jgi:hypothetical protein